MISRSGLRGAFPFRLRRLQGRERGGRARWTIVNTDIIGFMALGTPKKMKWMYVFFVESEVCLGKSLVQIALPSLLYNAIHLPDTSRPSQADTRRKCVQGHLARRWGMRGSPNSAWLATRADYHAGSLAGLDGGGLQPWPKLQCLRILCLCLC